MLVHVLACDYDGTIAPGGVVSPDTRAALARVRESGRRLVLVTGRMLDELRAVCPDLDAMFDAVVAENGALLYRPSDGAMKVVGGQPEPALVDALGRRGVPIALGASIIATDAPYAEPALAAIQETGVERTLVFNKGSLMLLPGGVTKATGLDAALAAFGLSPRNTIGIGDAENDHAFVAYCECAVAVADAVPALRERADLVTTGASARGVVELIQTHVLADAIDLLPRLTRHWITLGERADGTPVTIPAHRTRLLVVGPSAFAVVAVLVDRLVEAGRAVCVLDPGGDHRALAELEGVVGLGGKAKHALPTAEELAQLLSHPRTSLVLDLSALSARRRCGTRRRPWPPSRRSGLAPAFPTGSWPARRRASLPATALPRARGFAPAPNRSASSRRAPATWEATCGASRRPSSRRTARRGSPARHRRGAGRALPDRPRTADAPPVAGPLGPRAAPARRGVSPVRHRVCSSPPGDSR